jgi:hypothetical protein
MGINASVTGELALSVHASPLYIYSEQQKWRSALYDDLYPVLLTQIAYFPRDKSPPKALPIFTENVHYEISLAIQSDRRVTFVPGYP